MPWQDRAALITFFDFPAAHWQHLRTASSIEPRLAMVRLRMAYTRNCLSAKTAMAIAYKLRMDAQRGWRKLCCCIQLANVIADVKFIDDTDERLLSKKAA